MNAQEKFSELISLTQLYLSREYNGKSVCFTTPETYSYFQKLTYKPTKPFVPVPVPVPENPARGSRPRGRAGWRRIECDVGLGVTRIE